ncbi:hypothetical protein D3Z60_02595 [Lachnospiraceae bacterium]|jgi:hypothetical protein|nr:hypothetical protein [Lachnospiraceae bacterium]
MKTLNFPDIPPIANGTAIPNGILEQQIKEAKEKELRKQQWKHDFRIALFSVVSGAIAGFISSAILLHIQGLL